MEKFSFLKIACIVSVLCAATVIASHAQNLNILHNFCSQTNCADGSSPTRALIQGADGNFYGMTQGGGVVNPLCAPFCGTIFKITPTGVFTHLHSFCSQPNCADGEGIGALIQATDGNFYGTSGGGASGYGMVFKLTPEGVFTTLHSFDFTDGSGPSFLIQATDGNFYGTTETGGASANCFKVNCGTVFKLTPEGVFTTLHSFDFTDGTGPAFLIQATDGNFYGTTGTGGANCPDSGCGTVFKLTPQGVFTTLHLFDGTGARPQLTTWSKAMMGTSMGQQREAGRRAASVHLVAVRSSKLPRRVFSPICTASTGLMDPSRERAWCKPPMGTSTEQPSRAGRRVLVVKLVAARSSNSPHRAFSPRCTASTSLTATAQPGC